MGYLRECIGIASRHGRLEEVWRPHLEQTRRFILDSAERCGPRRHAVILGSGWLLDVPWQELAARFDRVSLVDLIHPPSVRRQVRAFPKVKLVTTDLTGIAERLFQNSSVLPTPPLLRACPESGMGAARGHLGRGQGGETGESPKRALTAESTPASAQMARAATAPIPLSGQALSLEPFGPVDFLASVNVLSQLPMIPLKFLETIGSGAGAMNRTPTDARKAGVEQEPVKESSEAFARSILEKHLERLQSAGCPACLVTDVESLTYDRAGTITGREDLLHGMQFPSPQQEWTWQLAPLGEIDGDHRTEHRVVGIRFDCSTPELT
jgi:hypothetical protein